MANRMLRDWTDSEKVNQLSAHAERFFTRLIMKADDFGCYTANPKLVKSTLFPWLIDEVREADISRWMAECQKAGLILLYEVEGKPYLQIKDFGQRLRAKKSKYPLPAQCGQMTAECGHMSDTRLLEEKRREEEEKANNTPEKVPRATRRNPDDYYSDGAQMFDEIKSDDLQVERLLRTVRSSGFTSCNEITLMKAVRFFITREEAKPDFQDRSRDEHKKYLVNWITKNAKNLSDYAG